MSQEFRRTQTVCSPMLGKAHTVMRALAVMFAAAMCASAAHAQPVECTSDSECSNGYCVKFACQACLQCKDFKRETSYSSCIKFVADCGPCLEGFTDERRGDVIGECLPPDPAATLPAYIVCIIVFVCIFILLGLFGAIFVYWKKNTIGNTVISIRACQPAGSPAQAHPSAPEAPPPYTDAVYTSVRPDSPAALYPPHTPYPPQPHPQPTRDEEACSPLVKRAAREGPRRTPREGAAREAAIGYSPPVWVRLPNPLDDENGNPTRRHSPDVEDNTAPHAWTPYGTNNNENDINGNTSVDEAAAAPQTPVSGSETASSLPALLEQARATTLVVPPPKKIKRSVSNSNGNGNREPMSASERGDGGAHTAAAARNIILNIQVNQHTNS